MSKHTEQNRLLNKLGHGRPMTRRDFLGRGLVPGLGILAAPSLLGLLMRSPAAYAQAADCGVATAAVGKVPFLAFDLSGGASIAGSNVIVGGPGGQLDFLPPEGYLKLGLPAGMTPDKANQVNTQLGLAFHADSAFLRGIVSKASPETIANVNGAVICARSENDTGNNPHNPMYGIAKAGADGSLVALIGNSSSESGGKSRAPTTMVDLSIRPTKVAKASDAAGLVNTGKLATLMNPEDAALVMKAVEQLSAAKINKLTESQLVKTLMTCSYAQTTAAATQFTPAALDPTQDAKLTQILTADNLKNEVFMRTASVMKLVINGYAGAGTIELGGYDYHDSTRATGERKDFAAGQAIGAALEYAKVMQKPLMIYVFSDGAVDSNGQIDSSTDGRGKCVWKGDNSSTASVFFLVYSPKGRPQLTATTKQQIGFFKANGSLETTATPISNNVDQLASAIVLNYMALNNDVSKFAQAVPTNGLGAPSTWDKLIAFQPII